MNIIFHSSSQETATGNSSANIEPGLKLKTLVVSVSAITPGILGNVVIKVQHSPDGTNWFDVPNLSTSNLTIAGSVTIAITDDSFAAADYTRLVWTFNGTASAITFFAFVTGEK